MNTALNLSLSDMYNWFCCSDSISILDYFGSILQGFSTLGGWSELLMTGFWDLLFYYYIGLTFLVTIFNAGRGLDGGNG